MIYYYGNEISPNQIETVEGFLICKNVPIARIGEQEYLARDLALDGDPERVIKVNRYEADVFEPATLASFEGKPVTDGHPPEEVEPSNFASYAKGHIQRVRREGDFMVADLYINDPNLINDVRNDIKREVSCGYICEYIPDGDNYKQTKIRGNHVAVVPRGRAGHLVSIKDENTSETIKKGGINMSKFTKELLKVFGTATKDASTEEIDKMAETTANAIDAGTKEKEQEGVKDEMKDEKEKTNDEYGEILKTILAKIEELGKKNDREEKMDRKLTDEDDLDKLIERLDGGEKNEDDEEAVTIPAEEMSDECSTADAIAILKRVRPAVASIKDKKDRARVVDALMSSIRSENQVSKILSATKDSATKNVAKSNPERAIVEQQKIYDSRNPHKKTN